MGYLGTSVGEGIGVWPLAGVSAFVGPGLATGFCSSLYLGTDVGSGLVCCGVGETVGVDELSLHAARSVAASTVSRPVNIVRRIPTHRPLEC